jgi:hypothetical protein
MQLSRVVALFGAMAMVYGCNSPIEPDDDTGPTITFPHTVTLTAEQGLAMMTGEVFDHADFINSDLVTYTNQTIKIQSGCPVKQTECRPLHVCKLTSSATAGEFDSVQTVCGNIPSEEDPSTIPNAHVKMGFTVKLNTAEGYARVWVKEVTGMGQSATVTLEYLPF